jgi:hypothetical protein
MKLLGITHCARPVLFANNNREYPYSIGGTAFVVKFESLWFVVTAKHVLNLRSFAPHQSCVQYRPDGRDFLPLGALYLVHGAEEDDTDQYDIAVREVKGDILRPDLFGGYEPYALLSMDRYTIYSEKGAYLFRGYPMDMREVDFDSRKVEQGSVTTRAEYVGRTKYASIRELRLLNLSPLQSIDGLSGSPVFQVHNEENSKYSREAFAGMIIRGSIDSGRAYIIEHKRIIEVLTDIVAGKVNEAGFATADTPNS